MSEQFIQDAASTADTFNTPEDLIGSFFENHNSLIVNICRRIDPDDFEDHAQDTYLRAIERWYQYDSNRSLISWISTIAIRISIDGIRRRGNRFVPLDERFQNHSIESNPAALFDFLEKQTAIKEALSEFSLRDKDIIGLYYFDRLKILEIADYLGMKPGAVKSVLDRARDRMSKNPSIIGIRNVDY